MNADDPSCDPGATSKHGVNGGGESSFSLSPPSVGLLMMVAVTDTMYVPVVILHRSPRQDAVIAPHAFRRPKKPDIDRMPQCPSMARP